MPEELEVFDVSENFVEDFFLKVLENMKTKGKHPEHLQEIQKKKTIKEPFDSLTEESQEIQILQEKQIPVPMPSLRTAPPLFKKTFGQVPVPKFKMNLKVPLAPKIDINSPFKQSTNFLDLARLNEFVQDREVTLIQCDGPSMPIKINKKGQFVTTNLALAEEEIKSIIHKFSFRAQVPVSQPVFRTQVNNLAITAITSDFSMPRFVIVKNPRIFEHPKN
jgi:hypothetical protein